ncbi:thiamine phosphate synthase [Thiobacter aerophilum]|uniref:Thiamine-phosphate synthase n=1 Tax=Thiobacter aerophilum TaxID=3121275 RepID=A0ABV0ECS0_9BURK
MKARIEGLYALTPDIPDTARLLALVKQALEGGAQAVQYRSKATDVALRHEQASELIELCHRYHVPLLVNDDVRLAALTDADGVHLGRDDAPLDEARINLGPKKIIGVSAYADLERARHLAEAGADYVALGSFFSSPTKPQAPLCPLERLTEAKRVLTVPVVAIGGITPENAPGLIAAGADALAVISALFAAPDVRLAAARFASLFATRH